MRYSAASDSPSSPVRDGGAYASMMSILSSSRSRPARWKHGPRSHAARTNVSRRIATADGGLRLERADVLGHHVVHGHRGLDARPHGDELVLPPSELDPLATAA